MVQENDARQLKGVELSTINTTVWHPNHLSHLHHCLETLDLMSKHKIK